MIDRSFRSVSSVKKQGDVPQGMEGKTLAIRYMESSTCRNFRFNTIDGKFDISIYIPTRSDIPGMESSKSRCIDTFHTIRYMSSSIFRYIETFDTISPTMLRETTVVRTRNSEYSRGSSIQVGLEHVDKTDTLSKAKASNRVADRYLTL